MAGTLKHYMTEGTHRPQACTVVACIWTICAHGSRCSVHILHIQCTYSVRILYSVRTGPWDKQDISERSLLLWATSVSIYICCRFQCMVHHSLRSILDCCFCSGRLSPLSPATCWILMAILLRALVFYCPTQALVYEHILISDCLFICHWNLNDKIRYTFISPTCGKLALSRQKVEGIQ